MVHQRRGQLDRPDHPRGVVSSFTDASIQGPRGIVAGADGALWFTNSSGNSIGRITPAGVVSAFTDASIDGPGHHHRPGRRPVVRQRRQQLDRSDHDGRGGVDLHGQRHLRARVHHRRTGRDLWFTNSSGNSIDRMTPAGVVSIFSTDVTSPAGITAGPDGALWFTNADGDSIGRITTAGTSSMFKSFGNVVDPGGIAAGPDGALWFTNGPPAHTIGRITTAGVVSSFAGSGLREPEGITTGPDGNLWVTNSDIQQGSIERITPAGVTTTFTDPALEDPTAITTGPDGALWFTDRVANRIGRITTAGVITTFTDPGIVTPTDIVSADGALWFANLTLSIGRITTAGVVTTFTGTGFNGAGGIAASPDGAIWFTNRARAAPTTWPPWANSSCWAVQPLLLVQHPGVGADRLRPGRQHVVHQPGSGTIGRVTPDGQTSDFFSGQIGFPLGLAAGPDGNLWFTNDSLISSVAPTIGRISTGGVVTIFPSHGLTGPLGITAGPDGNMWVTDFSSGR